MFMHLFNPCKLLASPCQTFRKHSFFKYGVQKVKPPKLGCRNRLGLPFGIRITKSEPEGITIKLLSHGMGVLDKTDSERL